LREGKLKGLHDYRITSNTFYADQFNVGACRRMLTLQMAATVGPAQPKGAPLKEAASISPSREGGEVAESPTPQRKVRFGDVFEYEDSS
jgi:hypothetical protein